MSEVEELTERQMAVFMLVQSKAPIRTSRVADTIGIKTYSALTALKALERKGKVARHQRYTYVNDISWTLPAYDNDPGAFSGFANKRDSNELLD